MEARDSEYDGRRANPFWTWKWFGFFFNIYTMYRYKNKNKIKTTFGPLSYPSNTVKSFIFVGPNFRGFMKMGTFVGT